MKNLKVIIIASLFFITIQSHAQELSVRLLGSVHGISELDQTYMSPGLSIEGKMGKKFTVGIDATHTIKQPIKMLTVNPNVKFYFNESFQGFFIGVGMATFRFKNEVVNELDDNFSQGDGSFTPGVGVEAMIGINTVLQDDISIGFKVGAGQLMSPDDSLLFNGNVSIGFMF